MSSSILTTCLADGPVLFFDALHFKDGNCSILEGRANEVAQAALETFFTIAQSKKAILIDLPSGSCQQ
jgi:hypothetical protein